MYSYNAEGQIFSNEIIIWCRFFTKSSHNHFKFSISNILLIFMFVQKKRNIIFSFCSGDLFDMLLPMLSIYQEYVRNHHYSLQVKIQFLSRAKYKSKVLNTKIHRNKITRATPTTPKLQKVNPKVLVWF